MKFYGASSLINKDQVNYVNQKIRSHS